jgi:hypothetical protein
MPIDEVSVNWIYRQDDPETQYIVPWMTQYYPAHVPPTADTKIMVGGEGTNKLSADTEHVRYYAYGC